ncbi:MAG: hypothetical protein K9M55_00515 [Candidatus Marinimicrobia bacterium]|nr:hypothetical protein [Candidatus Neomarinimicrobiota bacterium]MCF7921160.1 hypothetical protein [Candidatus Neomarinimicrobiota bacterium]
MFKKLLFLSFSVLMLLSCYPLGTFQGPDVLPEGQETVGMGLSWMSNIISLQDSSNGNETAFLADASLLFRRGFPNNTEIGIKFVGRPWANGAVLTDVKWLMIHEPVKVAVDFGMSYWSNIDIQSFLGYHPAVIVGGDKYFVVGQYNYVRSRMDVLKTQDLLLGRQFTMTRNQYVFTPLFGLHRDSSSPDNLFFSLGFGFTGPLDQWAKP